MIENTWFGLVIRIYIKVFVSARNAVGVGLLYMGLGIWLSKDNNPLGKWDMKRLVSAIVFLWGILYIEVSYTYGKNVLDDSSCFMALPLLTTMMFLLVQRIYMPISYEKSIEARKLSVYLYCLHPAINKFIGTFILKLFNNYLLNFVVNLTLCLIIWKVTKNSKNKFLRKVLP